MNCSTDDLRKNPNKRRKSCFRASAAGLLLRVPKHKQRCCTVSRFHLYKVTSSSCIRQVLALHNLVIKASDWRADPVCLHAWSGTWHRRCWGAEPSQMLEFVDLSVCIWAQRLCLGVGGPCISLSFTHAWLTRAWIHLSSSPCFLSSAVYLNLILSAWTNLGEAPVSCQSPTGWDKSKETMNIRVHTRNRGARTQKHTRRPNQTTKNLSTCTVASSTEKRN